MKVTYLLIGIGVIVLGIGGYFLLSTRNKRDIEDDIENEPEHIRYKKEYPSENVTSETIDTSGAINEVVTKINERHEEAKAYVSNAVIDIMETNEHAEAEKKEIDNLLNDLEK